MRISFFLLTVLLSALAVSALRAAPPRPHPHLDHALAAITIAGMPQKNIDAAAAGWRLEQRELEFFAVRTRGGHTAKFDVFTDGGHPLLRCVVSPAHPRHPRLAWVVFDSGAAGTKGVTRFIRGALFVEATGEFLGEAALAIEDPQRKRHRAQVEWRDKEVIVRLDGEETSIPLTTKQDGTS